MEWQSRCWDALRQSADLEHASDMMGTALLSKCSPTVPCWVDLAIADCDELLDAEWAALVKLQPLRGRCIYHFFFSGRQGRRDGVAADAVIRGGYMP